MNPFEEKNFMSDEEMFEVVDALFDEDDSEDESRIQFFEENI